MTLNAVGSLSLSVWTRHGRATSRRWTSGTASPLPRRRPAESASRTAPRSRTTTVSAARRPGERREKGRGIQIGVDARDACGVGCGPGGGGNRKTDRSDKTDRTHC